MRNSEEIDKMTQSTLLQEFIKMSTHKQSENGDMINNMPAEDGRNGSLHNSKKGLKFK